MKRPFNGIISGEIEYIFNHMADIVWYTFGNTLEMYTSVVYMSYQNILHEFVLHAISF